MFEKVCFIHFHITYGSMLNFNQLRLTAGRWFSQGTPVSSINKIDRHDITEIVVKVALNTTTLTLNQLISGLIQALIYWRIPLFISW